MKKYFLPIITTLFIFGCSSTKLYDKETESTKEVEHLKARVWGNEPFWNIDIYETYLIYQTPEHKTNKIKFSQHKSADKIAISSLDKNFPFVIEIEILLITKFMIINSKNKYIYFYIQNINN